MVEKVKITKEMLEDFDNIIQRLMDTIDEYTDKNGLISGRFVKIAIDRILLKKNDTNKD